MIRNALASLTQAELIRQPTSEFEGTGKHRLVKVANQDKLVELASQLGKSIIHDRITKYTSLHKI